MSANAVKAIIRQLGRLRVRNGCGATVSPGSTWRITSMLLLLACCTRSNVSPPPAVQAYSRLTAADLSDGVWAVIPDDARSPVAQSWPAYVVVPCKEVRAADLSDIVTASKPALVVPCTCNGRTLTYFHENESLLAPHHCSRSEQLVVMQWQASTRLVIRKKKDGRFAGEMVSGDGDGRVAGRFTLRKVDLKLLSPGTSARALRALAGADALDCGTAMDQRSADSVYQCAAQALAQRRRFFCRYAPPPMDDLSNSSALSPAPIGGMWARPATYVGSRDGRVIEAVRDSSGMFVPNGVVFDPTDREKLRWLCPGMTPPRLVSAVSSRLRADPRVSGILIFETDIRSDGAVTGLQLVKPLPYGVDATARTFLLGSKFRPSCFFGVPVRVIYNITVRADRGSLRITNPGQ